MKKKPYSHLDNQFITIFKKILIIDDDFFCGDSLKKMIEKNGNFSVRIAVNGTQGLEIYKEEEDSDLSMIITDISLPDIDGISLCKMIRESEKANGKENKIIIIGLTGHDSSYIFEEALKAGMNEIYTKPIDKPKLTFLLQKYFK